MTFTELTRYCRDNIKGFVSIDLEWLKHTDGEEIFRWRFYSSSKSEPVVLKSETIEELHRLIDHNYFPKQSSIEEQITKVDI